MAKKPHFKLYFPQRAVQRGEPLEFSVLSTDSDAELVVYSTTGTPLSHYRETHTFEGEDAVLRNDVTLDTSEFPSGEMRFILVDKANPVGIQDLVRVYINEYQVPEWVREATIIEFVAGAVRTQRDPQLSEEAIEELFQGMPGEAEAINANVIWVSGHYPFPTDRVETELDRTGQCGNAIFPYEHYAEAAFDLKTMLANAHSQGMRVVTYVDPAGVLTTTSNAEGYAKLDVFGNKQSHWPWIAYATCPNNPDWQEYIVEECRGVMELGFDGIFFDDANRPLHAMPCHCEYCEEIFKEKFNQEPPRYPGENYWQQWCEMPFQAMTDLIAMVRDAAKEFGDDKAVVSNANLMLWPSQAAAEDGHVSDFPGSVEEPVEYLENAAELYRDAQAKPIWLGHYYTPTVEHYARALALNFSMRSCTKIQYHFDYDTLSEGNPELAGLVNDYFGFWDKHDEFYTAQDHELDPEFHFVNMPDDVFLTAFEQWQDNGELTYYVHLVAPTLEKERMVGLELPFHFNEVLDAKLYTLNGDRHLHSKRGKKKRALLSGFMLDRYAVLEISTKGMKR